MRRSAFCVAAVVVASMGCGKPAPVCTASGQGSRAYDAQSYSMRGSFDWAASTLHAAEDVSLLACSDLTAVELDSKVKVTRVFAGAQPLDWTADASTLRVTLKSAARAGSTVAFTVEYEAPTSESLVAAGPRDDDPVSSRAVYTTSEPDLTPLWLVVDDAPTDRAIWSVQLTVAADEDVIANGRRTKDERSGDQRVVGYSLDKPLPAYLMAFAAGGLVHEDRAGRVPLSLWHRRGLPVDSERMLNDVADAMATFERLLMPYPWDSYSVVLLPQFSGGMENATITFNTESAANGGFALNAHELSHHWFGDWVTMAHFDDVWVKEGMATVLAAEADRARRDEENKGRLFGRDFAFNPGDAIVDEQLKGLDKYTSGPYERAAWTITQIRALVGETAFWETLRKILERNALGSIDGPGFVRSFQPALDEATATQIIAALPRHDVPQITVATTGRTVALTLEDPGPVLFVPLTLTTVSASAPPATASLSAASPVTLEVPADGYLGVDEQDVHPAWWDFRLAQAASMSPLSESQIYRQELYPLLFPDSAAAFPPFASRSAAQQETALEYGFPSIPLGADFVADGVYAQLDSTRARTEALRAMCLLDVANGDQRSPGLMSAIVTLLPNPGWSGYTRTSPSCRPDLVRQALGGELNAAAADLAQASGARLEYLVSFDYGEDALSLLSPVATQAPSLRLRELAVNRLAWQVTSPASQFRPGPTGAQSDAYRAFFRAKLRVTTSQLRLQLVWPAVVALRDAEALPLVAPLLHSVPMSAAFQRKVVCDSYSFAGASFASFQEEARPWETLAPEAAAVLQNPRLCTQAPKLPAEAVAEPGAERPPLELGGTSKTARESR